MLARQRTSKCSGNKDRIPHSGSTAKNRLARADQARHGNGAKEGAGGMSGFTPHQSQVMPQRNFFHPFVKGLEPVHLKISGQPYGDQHASSFSTHGCHVAE